MPPFPLRVRAFRPVGVVLLGAVACAAPAPSPGSSDASGDEDGDGYTAADGDCDDGDSAVAPDAAEVCGDGVDNDCDGTARGCAFANGSLSSADAEYGGEEAGDYAGGSISVGDFNADGYADLLVGASGNDAGGSGAGAAYVVRGGPAPASHNLAEADGMVYGVEQQDYAGRSVAAAGDMDGDGYDDVCVGIPGMGGGDGARYGAIYLLFGHEGFADGNELYPDISILGEANNGSLGSSVAAAGDVNGDGYADLIVGAPDNDDEGSYAGKAYLTFGEPSMGSGRITKAGEVYRGGNSGDFLGANVAGAGDVDGDGYDDMLLGAYGEATWGDWAGAAYLVEGSSRPFSETMPGAAEAYSGVAAGDHAGTAVSGAGDVNGDGYADALVGAPGSDAGGTDAGVAYLILGSAEPTSFSLSGAMAAYTGEVAQNGVGATLSGAGDVDLDGYGDFVVGASGGGSGGTAKLFFGTAYPSSMGISTGSVLVSGDQDTAYTGVAVAKPGDADGDGDVDLFIGGPSNPGGDEAGAVYLMLGGGL